MILFRIDLVSEELQHLCAHLPAPVDFIRFFRNFFWVLPEPLLDGDRVFALLLREVEVHVGVLLDVQQFELLEDEELVRVRHEGLVRVGHTVFGLVLALVPDFQRVHVLALQLFGLREDSVVGGAYYEVFVKNEAGQGVQHDFSLDVVVLLVLFGLFNFFEAVEYILDQRGYTVQF